MESISLTSLATEKLAEARQSHSGRAAHTIHGGHTHELRQTVLALLAGHELAEHDSPGEATLHVLQGHVRLTAGDDAWDGKTGDYVASRRTTRPARRRRLRGHADRAEDPPLGLAGCRRRPGPRAWACGYRSSTPRWVA